MLLIYMGELEEEQWGTSVNRLALQITTACAGHCRHFDHDSSPGAGILWVDECCGWRNASGRSGCKLSTCIKAVEDAKQTDPEMY